MSTVAHQFKIHAVHFFIAALTLVVALSWNDTIKSGIDEVYPGDRARFSAKFIYSLIITLFMVIIITYVLPSDPVASNPEIHPEYLTNTYRAKKFPQGYSLVSIHN